MDVYSSQPYCISFFYLQIKPFYMHLFYLHSLCAYSGGYPFSISGDIRSVPS